MKYFSQDIRHAGPQIDFEDYLPSIFFRNSFRQIEQKRVRPQIDVTWATVLDFLVASPVVAGR